MLLLSQSEITGLGTEKGAFAIPFGDVDIIFFQDNYSTTPTPRTTSVHVHFHRFHVLVVQLTGENTIKYPRRGKPTVSYLKSPLRRSSSNLVSLSIPLTYSPCDSRIELFLSLFLR